MQTPDSRRGPWSLAELLATLADDASAEAAASMSDLAVEYLARVSAGEEAVSGTGWTGSGGSSNGANPTMGGGRN